VALPGGAKGAAAPRVVHVAPVLFGDAIGGAERYVLELARAMVRRVPTTLLAFGGRPHQKRIGDLEIRVLRNWINFRRFRFDPLNPLILRELAFADVIHCHQPETMIATIALLYARTAGKPIFSSHLGGAGYGIHRLVDITNWYHGHLHISEFSRRYFGHQTLARARVVMGGVDSERFRPSPDVERAGDVLYVGRLLPHKGINYLVEAVDETTPLTIIGHLFRHERRFFNDLQRLAQRKRVNFLLNADDSMVTSAYQRALCVVLPSVHQTMYGDYHPIPELLGQTLLEAMACGTPAICTDVASLREIVEDGVTGFVVQPNDAAALGKRIAWLRSNPQETARMGAAARKRVLERFSWDVVVDRCLSAYGIVSEIAMPATELMCAQACSTRRTEIPAVGSVE